jgi:hypothetical protein
MIDKPDGKRWEDPQVVLTQIIAIFPAFEAHWRSPNNLALNEDGSFTYCGAWMEFGHFFRERYEQLQVHRIAELGAFVSECAESSNEELNTAVCTCFLENMAGERFCRAFQLHLTGAARRFHEAWSA